MPIREHMLEMQFSKLRLLLRPDKLPGAGGKPSSKRVRKLEAGLLIAAQAGLKPALASGAPGPSALAPSAKDDGLGALGSLNFRLLLQSSR